MQDKDHEKDDSTSQNSIRNESNQKKFYRKPSFWSGIINFVIAAFALYYAHLAYNLNREEFEWQKNELKSIKETKVAINANLNLNRLSLSLFKNVKVINNNHDTISASIGLYPFVCVKINNSSLHRVTVDEVKVIHSIYDQVNEKLISNVTYERDLLTKNKLPILLEPYDMKEVCVRIPWPIENDLRDIFIYFRSGRSYTPEECMKLYNKESKLKIEQNDYKTSLLSLLTQQITSVSYPNEDINRKIILYVILANGDTLLQSIPVIPN